MVIETGWQFILLKNKGISFGEYVLEMLRISYIAFIWTVFFLHITLWSFYRWLLLFSFSFIIASSSDHFNRLQFWSIIKILGIIFLIIPYILSFSSSVDQMSFLIQSLLTNLFISTFFSVLEPSSLLFAFNRHAIYVLLFLGLIFHPELCFKIHLYVIFHFNSAEDFMLYI